MAPCSPSAIARSLTTPPTKAETLSPSDRALVTSSSVAAVGTCSAPCANTQMLDTAMIVVLPFSDDLELVEELDDAEVALAVVLDDLAGLALGGGGDLDDLLTGAGPSDR